MLEEVRRMIGEGCAVTIRVRGGSMRPFIKGGRDSVRLISPQSLRRHDIVLAKITEGYYVLHRIIKIADKQLTLMGDGNLETLEHCGEKDVIAKVEAIIKEGREVSPAAMRERLRVALWLLLKPLYRCLLSVRKRLGLV